MLLQFSRLRKIKISETSVYIQFSNRTPIIPCGTRDSIYYGSCDYELVLNQSLADIIGRSILIENTYFHRSCTYIKKRITYVVYTTVYLPIN